MWPHFTFFGALTFLVEMALGVSLLLGVLTVLSEIGGALWQLTIALGSFAVPGEWGWQWPLLIAPHLVFAHSCAGRIVGLDLYLQQWLEQDPKGQAWTVSPALDVKGVWSCGGEAIQQGSCIPSE